ncbi:MAG: RnfABCDGE type electron transport complex subunit B [Clostridia bacterium]|nr:RnfABCDGE type electron transport complex subunit B [Clostridia bacterium]
MVQDILTALLVVASVGIAAGVLLALASHFFKVEEDETVKNIRDVLPGANCGACGYAGCDSYAEAVAKGDAAPNLCVPGAAAVAENIAGILGVECEAAESGVAFVACNGSCNATTKKAEYDGIESCAAAGMLFGGPSSCIYGCIGCGDCASVCPADAICIVDSLAHVDPRKCIGCSLCVKTCPKHIISIIPKNASTAVMCSNEEKGAVARKNCKNACIGCKKCQLNCPEKAITVTNNVAKIDYSKCSGCGVCADVCPTKCIKSLRLTENAE